MAGLGTDRVIHDKRRCLPENGLTHLAMALCGTLSLLMQGPSSKQRAVGSRNGGAVQDKGEDVCCWQQMLECVELSRQACRAN